MWILDRGGEVKKPVTEINPKGVKSRITNVTEELEVRVV